jgi:FkbM family methyltransferase
MKRIRSSVPRALNSLTFVEGRRGLRLGVLPTVEHQKLLRALNPRIVVDVGANRGQFSLDVRRSLPGAKVVAFEPLGIEADTYSRIFGHLESYALHRVALASVAGRANLHISAARDSSSLLAINERQTRVYPGTHEVGTQVVDVQTLDKFRDEFHGTGPALLKIDVQGGELDVLRGGAEALKLFRWVYLEMSFVELYNGQSLADEVVRELQSKGFVLEGLGKPSISRGLAVQVDALFLNSRP